MVYPGSLSMPLACLKTVGSLLAEGNELRVQATVVHPSKQVALACEELKSGLCP